MPKKLDEEAAGNDIKDPSTEPTFTKDDLINAMREVSRSMAEEMGPIVMAAAAAAGKANAQPQLTAQGRPVYNPGPVCPVCKQFVKACGGVAKLTGTQTQADKDKANLVNHVKMVVYPTRYPEFADWFRGRGLNGVWYLSNNASHAIWVPRAAAGDFQHAIETFETNERETRMGRTKLHNSGSVNSPKTVGELGTEGWR